MFSAVDRRGAAFAPTLEDGWESTGPGVRRQILAYDSELMMVSVEFVAGAVGPLHHHVHRQATYVVRGRFEVSVGDERRELRAGDSFFAEPNVKHGVTALEDGALLDVFTPAREDFLSAQ